jgi:hypothetical protein
MPNKQTMVQGRFTRTLPDGAVQQTTAWVEKKKGLAPGTTVTFKGDDDLAKDEEWQVESLGAEQNFADVDRLRDAQRSFAKKLDKKARRDNADMC